MDLRDIVLNKLERPMIKAAERTLKKLNKVATGDTVRSIRAVRTSQGFEVVIGGAATYIQDGRRPNNTPPPIVPIIEWMQARNIQANPWAIRQSIASNGIEPVDLDLALEQEMEQELERQLNDGEILRQLELVIQSRLI